MAKRATHGGARGQGDLFSVESQQPLLRYALATKEWPEPGRFPVNHATTRVRGLVWEDLMASSRMLIVAGFASIAQLIELVAARTKGPEPGRVRVLLGTEPFSTDRVTFGSPSAVFTDEVRRYWIEQCGVSLRLSAKIVQTLTALDQGWFEVRFVPGRTRMHAKIYVGEFAATVGSSNFTEAGLVNQFEANARFERSGDPDRYADTARVAENYWQVGEPWVEELRRLLENLLAFVSWQEALARACAELLEGQWASRYLSSAPAASSLWPSQIAGIAEAMWVVENVGSVLVADATGSGKTRMGAHLTRAVLDRLWSTGRVRGGLTVLVCPPSVEQQWLREAISCGLTLRTVSQGLLSRGGDQDRDTYHGEVGRAQILAIDEAHNFLAGSSNRTRQVRDANAEHVLLFTATPINRGAEDLLSLVDLLGADNFEDQTLELLDQLGRRSHDVTLTTDQTQLLRREIQRFTVRRTKTLLNELVDDDPQAYRHPVTGRVCRYPSHTLRTYLTGETEVEREVAARVRHQARALKGLTLLGGSITMPAALRREYTDERWLALRLGAAAGLAAHLVLAAMRSSTAALLEHLVGTQEAVRILGITGLTKPQVTGAILGKVEALMQQGPPRVDLACDLPDWLTDRDSWTDQCQAELSHYELVRVEALRLGDVRERAKADLVSKLSQSHARILAFDGHPITLAAIRPHIRTDGVEIITATGATASTRKQVRKRFAADSTEPGIALCTDAMSEGINLQGASAIILFDMPTTLRVAEQRVGRVDRMDSPYDVIEAWWPLDSEEFTTRADETLIARNAESASLLGSNLPIPDFGHNPEALVDVEMVAEGLENLRHDAWDGLRDALDPVRQLVSGPRALISAAEYAAHRTETHRVLARVSPIQTSTPWVFFAVRAHAHGAPRWILLEGTTSLVVQGLEDVTTRLRDLLAEDPQSRSFDDDCEGWLTHFLLAAAKAEAQLIPRRLQRALVQMHKHCRQWAHTARVDHDYERADRWEVIARLAVPGDEDNRVDLYQVAERWLELVHHLREPARNLRRHARYSRISDIDPLLQADPLRLSDVEALLDQLQDLEPFDQRVSACILGVPSREHAAPPPSRTLRTPPTW
jgi:superfamily II DNA or RNA helicase